LKRVFGLKRVIDLKQVIDLGGVIYARAFTTFYIRSLTNFRPIFF